MNLAIARSGINSLVEFLIWELPRNVGNATPTALPVGAIDRVCGIAFTQSIRGRVERIIRLTKSEICFLYVEIHKYFVALGKILANMGDRLCSIPHVGRIFAAKRENSLKTETVKQ